MLPHPPAPSPHCGEGEHGTSRRRVVCGQSEFALENVEQETAVRLASGGSARLEMRSKRPSVDMWQKLRPKARSMRHFPTAAEDQLWERLRARRLGGLKFRRQHAIGRFIVDFYCAEAGLIVEIDGPVHAKRRDEDAARQSYIEALRLRVVRFNNAELEADVPSVLAAIADAARDASRINTPSPHCGEGDGG